MTKEEKLAEEIEELTGVGVHIGQGNYEGEKTAFIQLWFNDMFSWALSYAMSFAFPGEQDIDKVHEKFMEWYNQEGKELLEEFNKVHYPEMDKRGRYKGNQVETYFKENCVIGAKVEKSINAFCGVELNDGLSQEEEQQEKKTDNILKRHLKRYKKVWEALTK